MDRSTTGHPTTATRLDSKRWLPEQGLPQRVADARSGTPHALTHLLEHIQPWLFHQLAACVEHPVHGGTLDAVQDANETILRTLPRYCGVTAQDFYTWLSNVAHRTRVRHRSLPERDQQDRTEGLPDRPDLYSGPEEHALRNVEHAQLRDAMTHLTTAERTLLELRILHGVPVADVAARLNRTIGSVRVGQHRALRRLRDLLAAVEGGTLPALASESEPAIRPFVPLSVELFTAHPYAALPRPSECPGCQASISIQARQCTWCGHVLATVDTDPSTRPDSETAVA